jgi:tRNA (mo5U34)-methyltransferase
MNVLPPAWQSYTPAPPTHGHYPHWRQAVDAMPMLQTQDYAFDQAVIRVGQREAMDDAAFARLHESLKALQPWRKGPFSLFGCDIDAEWRCDQKWQRVASHLNINGKSVLDVGCGNGYYLWRMLGAGAKSVVGIDPYWLYVMQFEAIRRFLPADVPVALLPATLENITPNIQWFDVVFSMGVLYHRKCPFEHLSELRQTLRPGATLVLETLVVEGEEGYSLLPEDRYAKMNNVWQIPSIPTLYSWLARCGFGGIETLDVTATTAEEQRVTQWSNDQSLRDFLDPQDNSRTIEGYPAPLRAVVVARSRSKSR